jgi:hypothetical protein
MSRLSSSAGGIVAAVGDAAAVCDDGDQADMDDRLKSDMDEQNVEGDLNKPEEKDEEEEEDDDHDLDEGRGARNGRNKNRFP